MLLLRGGTDLRCIRRHGAGRHCSARARTSGRSRRSFGHSSVREEGGWSPSHQGRGGSGSRGRCVAGQRKDPNARSDLSKTTGRAQAKTGTCVRLFARARLRPPRASRRVATSHLHDLTGRKVLGAKPACGRKQLVGDRANRSGLRWRIRTAPGQREQERSKPGTTERCLHGCRNVWTAMAASITSVHLRPRDVRAWRLRHAVRCGSATHILTRTARTE